MYESEIQFRKDISLKVDELADLFDPENLSNKISHQSLSRYGTRGLLEKLNVDPKMGIIPEGNEVNERQNLFGKNETLKEKIIVKSFFTNLRRVTSELHIRMPLLFSLFLFSFSFLSKAEQELTVQSLIMSVSILILTLMTTLIEGKKQTDYEKLVKSARNNKIRLIREGSQKKVKNLDVVVGDIILLVPGVTITVDCIIVEGKGIETDESRLCGEKNLKQKSALEEIKNGDPFIPSGSFVVSGRGKAVVCAVGEYSRLGMLNRIKTEALDTPSSLTSQISNLSNYLMKIGLIVASLTMFCLTCKNIANPYQSFPRFFFHFGKDLLTSLFIFCLSIPESLSILIFLSQLTSDAFAKSRKLETRSLWTFLGLGAIDSICFDKTGTLTTDSLDVSLAFLNDKLNNQIKRKEENKEILDLLSDAIAISSYSLSRAKLGKGADDSDEDSDIEHEENQHSPAQPNSSKLESCLLRFRKEFSSKNRDELLETIMKYEAFYTPNGEKYLFIAHRPDSKKIRVYYRGSLTYVVNCSSEQILQNGRKQALNSDKKKKIIDNINKIFGSQGLIGVAFAYAEFDNPTSEQEPGFGEVIKIEALMKNPKDLILIGVLGLKEQLKEEASHIVYKLKEAGIKIKVVTGDNSVNAIKCAVSCGILEDQNYPDIEGKYADSSIIEKSFIDINFTKKLNKQSVDGVSIPQKNKRPVMLGKELRDEVGELIFNPKNKRYGIQKIDQFTNTASNLIVLAQASSEEKKLLVDGLTQLKETVCFVGDGNNDVAAIKRADVGVGMGISSTELVKASSDAIILDDRLENLVIGIEWGRNILENIHRLIYCQLTFFLVFGIMVNINEIALPETPISLGQAIWIIILAKLIPGFIISTEQPSPFLMKLKTKDFNFDSVVSNKFWLLVLVQVAYYLLIFSVILANLPMPSASKTFQEFANSQEIWIKQLKAHYTMLFNCVGFLIIFTILNSRRIQSEERNIFQGLIRNTRFLFIWISTLIIHVSLVNYGGKFMKTSALTSGQNLSCLSIGLGGSVIHIIAKSLISFTQSGRNLGQNQKSDVRLEEEEEYKPLNEKEKEANGPINASE